jgi:hypothetical protein
MADDAASSKAAHKCLVLLSLLNINIVSKNTEKKKKKNNNKKKILISVSILLATD